MGRMPRKLNPKSAIRNPQSAQELSRRGFFLRSCGGLGATWLAAHMPEILAAQEHAHRTAAAGAEAKLEFFTPEQSAEIEAVAAQILPADSTPGAREARVIFFIDRALTTFDKDKQKIYLRGLKQLQKQAGKKTRFSELSSEQQIALLKKIEKSEFFELVRFHTIVGFFASPEYGGNQDRIGWKLIGFQDAFSFEPPFGYYDRITNDK